jgi:hypothetical protein
MGLVVYVRNLMLVNKAKRRAARRRRRAEAAAGGQGQGVPSRPHRVDRPARVQGRGGPPGP